MSMMFIPQSGGLPGFLVPQMGDSHMVIDGLVCRHLFFFSACTIFGSGMPLLIRLSRHLGNAP